ncbi:hypothetical protein GCM10009854_03000 [Saccharopolyspora halophila]|uniref:Uncharacterized protein n=1 Tax=Saccharopolyspora halophila TaxID=405551 RepID=A0ABN3FIW1_9PSEU
MNRILAKRIDVILIQIELSLEWIMYQRLPRLDALHGSSLIDSPFLERAAELAIKDCGPVRG